MAPEQSGGKPATRASDVYAWGLLARACAQAPLPPDWEKLVAKALREDPAERWKDAVLALESLAMAI